MTAAAYYAAHREEVKARSRAYSRAYREMHREEINAKHRARTAANPNKVTPERAAYYRAWREAHHDKVNASRRAYRATHRAQESASLRRQRYGSDADFDAILASQHGMCAGGCERIPTCLDHDHETGAVRGALCIPCNSKDVLAATYRTDPDLTPQEMSDFHNFISRVLEAPSAKAAYKRAYYERRKAKDEAVKVARLAENDEQARALGWL